MNLKECLNHNLNKSDDLCSLVEAIGYGGQPHQLQCDNGAYVSSLLAFFDDNPGAMEAVRDFIVENRDEMPEPIEGGYDDEEDLV
jgi:hypothetical protein